MMIIIFIIILNIIVFLIILSFSSSLIFFTTAVTTLLLQFLIPAWLRSLGRWILHRRYQLSCLINLQGDDGAGGMESHQQIGTLLFVAVGPLSRGGGGG